MGEHPDRVTRLDEAGKGTELRSWTCRHRDTLGQGRQENKVGKVDDQSHSCTWMGQAKELSLTQGYPHAGTYLD